MSGISNISRLNAFKLVTVLRLFGSLLGADGGIMSCVPTC